MHMKNVIPVFEAAATEHKMENVEAGLVKLTGDDIPELSESFPVPKEKQPLDIA